MINRINQEIDIAIKAYEISQGNDWRTLSRINGMIAMLEIAIGKSYGWNKKSKVKKS